MPSALMTSPVDESSLRLGDTEHWISPTELQHERTLVTALSRLRQKATALEIDPAFLAQKKQNFVDSKRVKMDAAELEEHARVVFDELPQPTALSIVTGPPGAAKTSVASLFTSLVRETLPDLPVVLITKEKPALHRLNEKMNLTKTVTLTLQEALAADAFPSQGFIILDEAGLCGTKDMATILDKAAASQARRLILIGDDKQLLPEEPGQPFRWLRENNKGRVVELTHSFRQKTADLRLLVESLHRGDVKEALNVMSLAFVSADQLIKSVARFLDNKPPERTLVIVHGPDLMIERFRVQAPGFRFYSLAAAQGLAIDEVVLVIAEPINLSQLLVGCSRQRFALDVCVDKTVYADRIALRDGIGAYPRLLMALDVIGEDAVTSLV